MQPNVVHQVESRDSPNQLLNSSDSSASAESPDPMQIDPEQPRAETHTHAVSNENVAHQVENRDSPSRVLNLNDSTTSAKTPSPTMQMELEHPFAESHARAMPHEDHILIPVPQETVQAETARATTTNNVADQNTLLQAQTDQATEERCDTSNVSIKILR